MYRSFLLPLIIILLSPLALSGQAVWPGDINNNGTVSGVDLLYWGWAFGSTGPQRTEMGDDWQAYALPAPWSQNFPSGLNYAYADCNGDGVVDEEDFDGAIEGNFGEVNGPVRSDGFANGTPGAAPRIRLETSTPVVLPGSVVNIRLRLDDSELPVEDFYGIAMSMKYDADLLEGDDGPDFELSESSWINANDAYVEDLMEDNDDAGTAMLAITRTDQRAVPVGEEQIGLLSVVIEDIIVGREIDTLTIEIDSVRMISNQFQNIPTVTDKIQIIVAKDTTGIVVATDQNRSVPRASVSLFPNPVKDEFLVEAGEPIETIFIVDAMGRKVKATQLVLSERARRLRVPGLPAGIYSVIIGLPNQSVVKKIISFNNH